MCSGTCAATRGGVREAPVNYFEATLAFGDLTPAEARDNLAAFAETVMPALIRR